MKNILFYSLLILFISFNPKANAQSPNWLWATSAGGNSSDFGESITTDADGNILVIGYFLSPSISFGTTTFTNAGIPNSSEIYVVKYDAAGNVLWASSPEGNANDYAEGISTDAAGNVYVTGYFQGAAITFGTTTLTNAGSNTFDIFIVKYDPEGNVLWAKSEGGINSDHGRSIQIDPGGNILITGDYFSPSITFGNTTLTTVGNGDIFVAKYDSDGNLIWAKSAGGSANDRPLSIATDSNGNVVVAGNFLGLSITFGTIVLPNLVNPGATDFFIVKYDPEGNELWAHSGGGTGSDSGNSVSIDVNENILVAGDFTSASLTLGSSTITNFNEGNADIFIVKYNPSGDVLWAKSAGKLGTDSPRGITTDAFGNIWVTGSFNSATITLGNITLSTAGNHDIFVAKYDDSGNVIWATSVGGTGTDFGYSISTDGLGNVLITGDFNGSSAPAFGNTTLTTVEFSKDMFVAKLDVGALGTSEYPIDNNAIIYPNPFSISTTINLQTRINSGQLHIYNLQGQEVYQKTNISGQTIPLTRDHLASGVYFISLTEDDKVIASKKLIIID